MAITDYGYKRKITIDHTVVDATETDYPAMVKLYQDDTAPTWSSSGSYTENDVVVYNNQYFRKTDTATNKEPFVDTDWNLDWTYLGEHLDFSLVRNDGFDFRFTSDDGQTLLDYERELFNIPFKETTMDILPYNDGWTYSDGMSISEGILTYYADSFSENNTKYYSNMGDMSVTKTIEAKVSVDSNSTGEFRLNISDGNKESKLIFNGLDKTGAIKYYNTSNTYISIVTGINFSGWHIYKVELNSINGLKVYIDGIQVGSTVPYSNLRTTTNTFFEFASRKGTVYYDWVKTNDPTENNKAVFYVRIPSVSSSVDTDYYMYYGYADATDGENATGVWDSNFVMVQHMGSSLADSTSNGNDGTNYGSTVVNGLNGKARSFDGVDDYIQIQGYKGILSNSERHSSFMFKSTDIINEGSLLYYGTNITGEKYRIRIEETNGTLRIENTGGYEYGDIIITDGTFKLLDCVLPNSSTDVVDHKLYVNNTEDISTTSSSNTINTTSGSDVIIGKNPNVNNFLEMVIDEVRISNIARSDAWIKMDDANLRTWSLQSVGVEESTAATNTTEPLAKTLIDENLVNATDTDRNISILSVIENQGRGTVQEVETSNERLDKILEKILAVDDYGHKIYIDDGLKYDVIVPETKSVQFSNKIYNLLEARQQLSESNYKTFVYIDGDTTSDAYGTSTGFDRKELYLSTTTDTGLQDKAKQELDGKYYQTNAIQGKIRIVGNPFEYKTDYDLGDIVTVIFNDTVYTVQITEITESYTPNGFELDLTFGTPRRDFATLIQDIKEAK